MSFLVHRINEGEICRQGINWSSSSATKLRLVLRLWRFNWYLRIRQMWLCEAPNSCKKFVFDFSYSSVSRDGFVHVTSSIEYNYQMNLFRIENKLVTRELLTDMIASLHDARSNN